MAQVMANSSLSEDILLHELKDVAVHPLLKKQSLDLTVLENFYSIFVGEDWKEDCKLTVSFCRNNIIRPLSVSF